MPPVPLPGHAEDARVSPCNFIRIESRELGQSDSSDSCGFDCRTVAQRPRISSCAELKRKVVPRARYDRSVGKPGCSRHGKCHKQIMPRTQFGRKHYGKIIARGCGIRPGRGPRPPAIVGDPKPRHMCAPAERGSEPASTAIIPGYKALGAHTIYSVLFQSAANAMQTGPDAQAVMTRRDNNLRDRSSSPSIARFSSSAKAWRHLQLGP